MFEYIKRVSVAINFVAQKIEKDGDKIRSLLEDLSLELLSLSQEFRGNKFELKDLQILQKKVLYIIDLVDSARISGFISQMNAKVFIDSQVAFLKHISKLIEQKNSIFSSIYKLKELDEFLARKSAKENSQNQFASEGNFAFNENVFKAQEKNFNYAVIIPKTEEKNLQKELLNENEKKGEKDKIEVENNHVEVKEQAQQNVFSEKEIEARRANILAILTSGGCSIKEISSKMQGINEKTIQRDLLELMQDKKVIMLGKKRWARYYLK